MLRVGLNAFKTNYYIFVRYFYILSLNISGFANVMHTIHYIPGLIQRLNQKNGMPIRFQCKTRFRACHNDTGLRTFHSFCPKISI